MRLFGSCKMSHPNFRNYHRERSESYRKRPHHSTKPLRNSLQKTPNPSSTSPQHSAVLDRRLTGICTFWGSEDDHGFFTELLNGWRCKAYESDIIQSPNTKRRFPARGEIVEFSIHPDTNGHGWLTNSSPGNPLSNQAARHRRLRITNLTRPGSLPLDEA